MQEIKCPNCGEIFAVDDTGYAKLVQQVRDKEFEKELKQREKNLQDVKEKELTLERMKQQEKFDKELLLKQSEIVEKEKTIEQLRAQISGNETEKKLAISEAINQKQKEQELAIGKKNNELTDKEILIEQLKAQIENNENERKVAVSEALKKQEKEREKAFEKKNEELAEKICIIEGLKAELKNSETERKLAVSEAVQNKEKELSKKVSEITELKNKLSNKELEFELKEQSQQKEYENMLKQKDEQIEYFRDFKARQSNKIVGESLEQHCLNEFNAIRMAAFPNAYFEKDNDARKGSKGDFIFREAIDGTEFISIMFEMKNEMDETVNKHKNEDFFKKLDKDRREKNCEYAVLVSLLEIDNELYNQGIVDVSYKYEKMYVIRPQFFIPIITLLRNAASKSIQYIQELAVSKSQELDIVQFENNMNDFKDKFARDYRLASSKFKTAIDEIDKTILHLQKTKEALISSENHLRLANNKAEDLSIKKLTKNAPSVKEMFDEKSKNNI